MITTHLRGGEHVTIIRAPGDPMPAWLGGDLQEDRTGDMIECAASSAGYEAGVAAQPAEAGRVSVKPPFCFDRYIDGKLMAEGVTIERHAKLSDAMRAAAKLAAHGPNGEVPVLVLAALTPACPECGDTGMRDTGGVHPWGEYISVPCDCATLPAAPVKGAEKPCCHEWYQGACVHCEITVKAFRALAGGRE